MTPTEHSPITALLAQARGGDPEALNRRFDLCRN